MWLPALLEDRPPSQLRVAPASHSGELLGLLVIERAADGDHFTEEDDRVLTELARQVGLALHNVQLDSALQESLENLKRANEDLRASRARIVATGDAERRKIERNLHDGAQQHLVALAVNLRLTKDILADDPEAAAEMLDALGDAVKDTIQELRDLAHGIYPPLLMDAGLTEALRAAANRSPLAVSVDAEGVGRYPTELEAAVYFCCLEALQNAAKHAPEASVADRAARGRRRRCSFSVQRRRPRLRRGGGHRRPRLREHERPARRHRRHGRVALRARRGSRDRGHHPAVVTDADRCPPTSGRAPPPDPSSPSPAPRSGRAGSAWC